MNKSFTLDFSLGREIQRIEKADSFALYILKCQIEKALDARNIAQYSRELAGQHKDYVYFDKETEREEILTLSRVYDDHDLICGTRKSDQKDVEVDPESLDLTRIFNSAEVPEDEERVKVQDSWKSDYRTRIAYERYVNLGNYKKVRTMMIGYLAKWNHHTLRMQLLSGESILFKDNIVESHIFHPTIAEHKLFDKYESDIEHQKALKNNITLDVYDYLEKSRDIKYLTLKNKLLRHMTLYGHDIKLSEQIFEETYKSQYPSSNNFTKNEKSVVVQENYEFINIVKEETTNV